MKTKYYLPGGIPPRPAYGWRGYTLPGLTRVAADTRGLSGLGGFKDPQAEYLPYRASGPEPLDPGELGDAGDGLGDFSSMMANTTNLLTMSVLGVPVLPAVLAVGAAIYFLRKKPRSNPARRRRRKRRK